MNKARKSPIFTVATPNHVIDSWAAPTHDDALGGDSDTDDDEPDPDVLGALLEKLPAEEADAITMYYRAGMSEGAIAKLLGLRQQTISWRLKHAREWLRWLATWPGVGITEKRFRTLLWKHFSDEDIDLMWAYKSTTSKVITGQIVGLPIGAVRFRVRRCLRQLEIMSTMYADVERIYVALRMVGEKPKSLQNGHQPRG